MSRLFRSPITAGCHSDFSRKTLILWLVLMATGCSQSLGFKCLFLGKVVEKSLLLLRIGCEDLCLWFAAGFFLVFAL